MAWRYQQGIGGVADVEQVMMDSPQSMGAGMHAAVGDIDRFPSEAQPASFTGAAPRQIASASRSRHRLNREAAPYASAAITAAAPAGSRAGIRLGGIAIVNRRDTLAR